MTKVLVVTHEQQVEVERKYLLLTLANRDMLTSTSHLTPEAYWVSNTAIMTAYRQTRPLAYTS